MTTHYVQFFRGTPQAYTNLLQKNSDTLYFISETNDTKARIYLGSKEITGSMFGISTLADIEDIEINSGNLNTGDILVYDDSTNKWVTSSFSAIADVMVGATASVDGSAGIVPAPLAGSQNKFLRGDGTWADVDFSGLEAVVSTLIGSDTNKSAREIAAEEVAKIVADAPASLDTLQEISAWILDHPDSATDLSNRLTAVEGGLDSLEDRVEILESSITFTGDLNATILALQQKDTELENAIDVLDNRLKWQELEEEENNG